MMKLISIGASAKTVIDNTDFNDVSMMDILYIAIIVTGVYLIILLVIYFKNKNKY